MIRKYKDRLYVDLHCDDGDEILEFTKYPNCEEYSFDIKDSYCGHEYNGIRGRIKRAWRALIAKPIYYTGIFTENKDDVVDFLEKCLEMLK